jgi:phosphopantetheine adenylyltransferase
MAGKNLHMTHLEDAVLYNGIEGTKGAIDALKGLTDTLEGNTSKRFNTTVKWDGAPAVFAGSHPAIADGQFFVAKKGIFNKNPKVYTTDAEIDADTSGDLAEKLKAALKYLPQIGIQGIVQGDLMFTEGDKRVEEIDGERYIVFQPNTIAYAIPVDSGEGRRIAGAKLGIVFHTRYSGDSIEDMKASFDVDANEFRKAMDVWYQDARVTDLSGTATMTKDETAATKNAIAQAEAIFSKIDPKVIQDLESKQHIAQMIETYNNTFVRAGENIGDTTTHTKGLIEFIRQKFQKEIDARKTEKGKTTQRDKLNDILTFFSNENLPSIKTMFDLQKAIVAAKLMIIRKLETLAKLNTFVLTKDGYRTTGEEGYVAIDHLSNGAYKLVDRMEFSSKNFNPDIIKGWQRESVMNEQEGKSIVAAFGRFNPPTIGHLKLIEKAKQVAAGGDYAIFASHSVHPKKNPLSYEDKMAYLKDMFPNHADRIIASEAKDPLQVLAMLNKEGYSHVRFIAGSDRVDEYQERFAKYNGKLYDFDTLEVISAGERDPDAEGAEGMSASKMRAAAAANDFGSFQKGLPTGYDGRKLFHDVRVGMKLAELYETYRRIVSHAGFMGTPELVKKYKEMTPGQLRELARGYRTGVKSTDAKRKAHFKKQSKMRDDDPSAYKKAPGDSKPPRRRSSATIKVQKKMQAEELMVEISAKAKKSLKKKADKYNVPLGTLTTVYRRGLAAWKTGHRPGAGQQQWGHARVNSFLTGGKTRSGADKDQWERVKKHRKKKKTEQAIQLAEKAKHYMDGMSKEKQCKIRIVKTTKPEHKKDEKNWRIRGKRRPEVSLGLYKNKPSIQTCVKRLKQVAGHEYGKG